MPELYDKFKQEMKQEKIEIIDSYLGITIDIDNKCSKFYLKESAPVATTTFKGINVKGKYSSQNVSHVFQLSIKLTLGVIALEIGLKNLAQLLSLLDLSKVKTVKCQFFRNMELIIRPILRKVGNEAIEKAIDKEIILTLRNDEEKYKQRKEGHLPVAITVPFDIGCNKRSSGNHYDSISGHVFL